MSENKTETVVIVDKVEPEVIKMDLSVVDPLEQELAAKHKIGVEKEVEEGKEGEKKVEKKEESKEETILFEDVEKDEKGLLGKFTKNEQGIYFRWKHDKKLRQDAQAERDLKALETKTLKTELEKAKEDGTLTVSKLGAIEKLMNGPQEDITIEAIQEILKTVPKKEDKEDKPLTKKDLTEMQEEQEEQDKLNRQAGQAFQQRVTDVEKYAEENYENYDEITECAKAVFEGKVDIGVTDNKDLARRFTEKLSNNEVSEEDVCKFVLGVAKLNPDYTGKKVEKKKEEEKSPSGEKKVTDKQIDKIVKNAEKNQAGAQGGGNGRRVVNVNDITVEDAAKLSIAEYKLLPAEVKARLRKESDN